MSREGEFIWDSVGYVITITIETPVKRLVFYFNFAEPALIQIWTMNTLRVHDNIFEE